MTFSQIVACIILPVSVGLLGAAVWTLCRWRPKNFDSTTGYTRNLQRIPAGKKIEIQVPGEDAICKAGSRHGPLIYYEIIYRVNGKEYMLYEFGADDTHGEPIPMRWPIRYRPDKPSFAYRDVGGIREGEVLAGALIILGLLFFVSSLLVLL